MESTNKKTVISQFGRLTKRQQDFFEHKFGLATPVLEKLDKILIQSTPRGVMPLDLKHFGTQSGRYTAYGANILNFPKSQDIKDPKDLKEIAKTLRSVIIAPPGKKFLAIDLKQIEFRVSYG